MKILVVGDGHSDLHEKPVCRSFRELGHEATLFSWHQYFLPGGIGGRLMWLVRKAQNKYQLGPLMRRINRDLLARVLAERPQLLFVYRGTHVYPETLRRIREALPDCILVGYNNDDPFSSAYPRWMWRHFLAGVPLYDLVLAYRHHNIGEFLHIGARRVELLRSWYLPERNFPQELTADESRCFAADVVFIGHYEPDLRLRCLEAIARTGWNLKLFGHDYGWHPILKGSLTLRKYMPLQTVWGSDYNKALCGARIALCFLSKQNRDTYTRRCFEIPASGTLMLAERTDDLMEMFREGEEADFFSSAEELAAKVAYYMGNPQQRDKVASAGRARVVADGHEVVSRMRQVLEWVAAMDREYA